MTYIHTNTHARAYLWNIGLYVTPTLAGSRPGALSVCAWASMMTLGVEGYRARAWAVVRAARTMASAVEAIPGLRLLTLPPVYMMVSFTVDDTYHGNDGDDDYAQLDIYQVKDALHEKSGWTLNALQNPAAISICVTLNIVPNAEQFGRDLKVAVDIVRDRSRRAAEADAGAGGNSKKKKQKKEKTGTAGIYGAVSSVPAGPVEHLLCVYTDMTLAP
jgi:sphinganine-1-phosphate aldolase